VNLAIQGPNAREKTQQALPESLREAAMALKPFACLRENGWQVARTGYTGEDGFEVILPETQAAEFWNALLAAGVKPCGLGARDTLRLEAGLNLYGADMDETVSPLESNIAWTVAFKPEERNFIGRAALEKQQAAGSHARLVGLLLNERGMLRGGQAVSQDGKQVGEIVSGGFSPLLKKSVAFARINTDSNEDCTVAMRGKEFPVEIVQLPFVRKGEVVFKLLKEVECHD
jgi:aminomethyltransferase